VDTLARSGSAPAANGVEKETGKLGNLVYDFLTAVLLPSKFLIKLLV
jgi:hypothetical protein